MILGIIITPLIGLAFVITYIYIIIENTGNNKKKENSL